MNILEKITNESQRELYFKYASVLPFDVIGFAQELGIEIRESGELSDKVSGFIKKVDSGKTFICVNQKHHLNRQRFTIAHELGHYFLHQDKLSNGIIDELNREDGVNNQIEFDANEFGASLLMPEVIFRQYWEENYSVKNMADNFSVSESAIITRAKFLGLFSRDDYGYFV